MANLYKDNKALKFQLSHPMMKKLVDMRERNYEDKDKYDFAPVDFDDAIDNYDKVLEILGDICSNVIAPNAEDIDHEGPSLENNRVSYAKGTVEDMQTLIKAGVYGIGLPRQYGGQNFSMIPYIMFAELIAQADASFNNIWGLQDCAETINEFGSEEQKKKYLPRIQKGDTCSMDLTEPDAGSDLQSVMLHATYSEKDDCWYLNGVKRFITNGDADIKLVLARSEDGSRDGRGLSYFICENHKDNAVKVRRIENKLGIKGSPTCELVFTNAKAELVGSRKMGLIKYVMSLMNGARLGIGAQSVGVLQTAYNEALKYANERRQFGKPIAEFPAIYEILALMNAKLDASRALLYETSRFVDGAKLFNSLSEERTLTKEERTESKDFQRKADALTPMLKLMSSEYANQCAYDCIQIHGGSGFMKEYTCERLYRDARILSIYEGTSQLQVVAAIRHVLTGTYVNLINQYAAEPISAIFEGLQEKLSSMTQKLEESIQKVEAYKDAETTDFLARRLVEMASHIIMGHLLIIDASRDEMFKNSAFVYVQHGHSEVEKHYQYITEFKQDLLTIYKRE